MIPRFARSSAFIAIGCLMFGQAVWAIPAYSEVRAAYTESDALLLARDGQPLQSKRIDMAQRRLPWTRIEDVSPALLRALLASEDRKFYEHSGVDWGAAAVSAWRNLWNTRTRGASTLSMQLVGLLEQFDKENPPRQGRRSVSQKFSQAAAALWLEQRWKKDEILEAYLNLAGFRGEMLGVAAMSRGLFGKWPDGLDERESALAVSLLRAPGASPQLVATRACGVLQTMAQMKRASSVSCEGLDGLARLALSGGLRDQSMAGGASWLGRERSPGLAPHLAQKLLVQPGERLKSTLDADLQRFARASLQRQLQAIARQNAEDGALLVLDNARGEVLAWVGSSGVLSAAPEVDGVVALRQAGSTLKPFLYELAFERRDLTAASLIDDSPLAITTGNGLYVPQNYSPDYRGWVSARMALGGSLNVPAVRTLVRIGPDNFRDRLYDFGFKSLTENGDYYGFSLALGSADVSLLMLANAYRALANGGEWSPLRVTAEGERKPCSDGGCRGVFAGEAMHDVSGVSGAAPVWREVMDWLHRGRAKAPGMVPAVPAGVTKQAIRFEPPGKIKEASRQEWFLAGTGMPVVHLAANKALAHIAYPGQGTIIALDPDIPPERQRVALQLSGQAAAGWQWRIDGKPQGPAVREVLWRPMPGRHRLTLLDAAGVELDAVDFEVRALKGKLAK